MEKCTSRVLWFMAEDCSSLFVGCIYWRLENDTSIIVDASKYIEELKEKVERLNQDIVGGSQSSINKETIPSVTVETLEKGFLINVHLDKSSPGLLVSILEAFEALHLNVVEASASCTEKFQLEAFSIEGDDDLGGGNVDAQAVRQAVLQAINRNRHPRAGQN